jgi:hypothetical protein
MEDDESQAKEGDAEIEGWLDSSMVMGFTIRRVGLVGERDKWGGSKGWVGNWSVWYCSFREVVEKKGNLLLI